MKIARFVDTSGRTLLGVSDDSGHAQVIAGELLKEYNLTDEVVEIARWLPPIAPSSILGIGLNYREHARETNAPIPKWPVVFFKNLGSLCATGDSIVLPRKLRSDKVDYECELAVVIGKACRNVSRENALDYVFGYTCGNDVSARDWQKEWGGSQWCRGKSFDTFCPLGPVIVTADEIPDPNSLGIRTILNGEAVQDLNTSDMIFPVAELIEFLSGSTTLLPGTVILTGTPQGVGVAANPQRFLLPGDEVTVEIDRIGRLINAVVEEQLE